MRILHFSDIHFGIETYSRIDPQSGLPTRLLDFTRATDRAIERGMSEGIDAVIFTGDAYKNRDPNPTVQREFARRIQKIAASGVPVFLLTGNHDLPNMSNRAHAIEIFDTLSVPGVHVARDIGITVLRTKSGPLQVVSLPWVTRAGLIAREEYRGRSLGDLDQMMIERIEHSLALRTKVLDPNIPAILAVHASIAGSVYSSERSIMLGHDLVIQKSILKSSNFDYVAVGHIHKHQVLEADGVPVVYPGSIERIDFGEEKETKGFVLVNIEDRGGGRASRHTAWEFIPDHQTRPFRTIDLRIDNLEPENSLNPTAAALNELEREIAKRANNLEGAIVRLKVRLRPDQEAAFIDEEIRKKLTDLKVYHIASVAREVDRPRRTRLAGMSVEELTPLQLLEKYLESKQINPRRIDLLLKRADTMINGSGTDSPAQMQ